MRNVIALTVLAAAVLPAVAGQAQTVDICDRRGFRRAGGR